MNARQSAHPFPWVRVALFALAGGSVALVTGLLAVQMAPENGFADLAAAAVTKVFLVPFGVVAAAVIGWRTGIRQHADTSSHE